MLHCKYRQSIALGECYKSSEEVTDIVIQLARKYTGSSYHLLKRNCNNFSDELSLKLVERRIPRWINRLAKIGSVVSSALPLTMTEVQFYALETVCSSYLKESDVSVIEGEQIMTSSLINAY